MFKLGVSQYLTLKALECFKEFYDCIGAELLMVLGSNLDAHLEVLPKVGLEHGLDALEGVLD